MDPASGLSAAAVLFESGPQARELGPSRPSPRQTGVGYSCGMSNVSVEEDRLKELLKAALVEVLEERGDLVRELVAEAVEDMAMVRALEEGEQSPRISREDVFRILEPGE